VVALEISCRGPKVAAQLIGCSEGFEVKDDDYRTCGSKEDGRAAIKGADAAIIDITTIDGKSLDSCNTVSFMLLIFPA
jgi:hypothetical protein